MMSKDIRRLDLFFTDPNNSYKAGQAVSGCVYLELSQTVKIKGVRLSLQGTTRVNWDENRAYTKGSASKLYHKNMEVCLDVTTYLSRTPSLAPGAHEFRFSEMIPEYCPSSFEGQWGKVQYVAKVSVERASFGKSDVEATKPFVIIGVLDLNIEPESKSPAEAFGTMQVGGLCCKRGPVSVDLFSPKRGYVASEKLPFELNLRNSSRKKVYARVSLQQQVTFRADQQVKKTKFDINMKSYGEVKPGAVVKWVEELPFIPPVPPTNLGGGCKNIEVKYALLATITRSGLGKNLEVPAEIILGTIPLRKSEKCPTPKTTVRAAAKQSLAGEQMLRP